MTAPNHPLLARFCAALYGEAGPDGWADWTRVYARMSDVAFVDYVEAEWWAVRNGFADADGVRLRLTKTGVDLALWIPV